MYECFIFGAVLRGFHYYPRTRFFRLSCKVFEDRGVDPPGPFYVLDLEASNWQGANRRDVSQGVSARMGKISRGEGSKVERRTIVSAAVTTIANLRWCGLKRGGAERSGMKRPGANGVGQGKEAWGEPSGAGAEQGDVVARISERDGMIIVMGETKPGQCGSERGNRVTMQSGARWSRARRRSRARRSETKEWLVAGQGVRDETYGTELAEHGGGRQSRTERRPL